MSTAEHEYLQSSWTVHIDRERSWINVAFGHEFGGVDCKQWHGPINDTEIAIANRIAAAPDLLSQLEIAVASGKSWRGISEARAAIAKARGQNDA